MNMMSMAAVHRMASEAVLEPRCWGRLRPPRIRRLLNRILCMDKVLIRPDSLNLNQPVADSFLTVF